MRALISWPALTVPRVAPTGEIVASRAIYPIWGLAINEKHVFVAAADFGARVEVFDKETLAPVATLGEEIFDPSDSPSRMDVVDDVLHVEWGHADGWP